MIPKLHTPFGEVPTFSLCVIAGLLVLLLTIHLSLKKAVDRGEEEAFIFPRVIICAVVGLVASGLFDSFFKFLKYGEFRLRGITFYGGLIGAAVTLAILLKFTRKPTQYSMPEWFDLLTPALILFHACGRIGCFLGGCCYGKPTDSFLGMAFPDQPEHGIFHEGLRCYPTQLYEAILLVGIFFVVLVVKKKFRVYLLCYAIARFLIECLRGDDRGALMNFFSPAQWISLGILAGLAVHWMIEQKKKKAVL